MSIVVSSLTWTSTEQHTVENVNTFHMLASLPYTTAMLLTLLCWMLLFSVSFSSSETKPMKELSGVWAERQCVCVCVFECKTVARKGRMISTERKDDRDRSFCEWETERKDNNSNITQIYGRVRVILVSYYKQHCYKVTNYVRWGLPAIFQTNYFTLLHNLI